MFEVMLQVTLEVISHEVLVVMLQVVLEVM